MKRLVTLFVVACLWVCSTAGAAVAQSLVSDQSDYAPGTTATFTGTGFGAYEQVTVQVLHADGTPATGAEHEPWTVTADADGGFVTTWHVCEDDCVGSLLEATATGSSGAKASTQFTDAGGTGVVSVAAVGGSCVAYTPANAGGPDNWEVREGGTYTMTITGVTECSGSAITVFVQGSSTGNFCFTLTGGGGTYSGTFTMPNPACFTYPISYKCGANASCDNSSSFAARGPSGSNTVHLRAATFDASCNLTGQDTDCSAGCTAPPQFIGCASGSIDLGCNPLSLPVCSNDVRAVDCHGNPVAVSCNVGNDVVNGCFHSQTITYTATAGAVGTCSTTYTWKVDKTAPALNHVPAGGDLGCNPATLPSVDPSVTASDECDGNVAVETAVGKIAELGGCRFEQRFAYSATDACGNTVSQEVVYTWKQDTTAPVLSNVPAGGDLGCNPGTLPGADPSVTASDECDGNVAVETAVGKIAELGGCRFEQKFAYSATDACGNTASQEVTYSWKVDHTAPVLALPADVQLECGQSSTPGNTGTATANDECDGNVQVTSVDLPTVAGCAGVAGIDRQWVATDECGNTVSGVQHIRYVDTTPPTISCPDNVRECLRTAGGNIVPIVTPGANDNCAGSVPVTPTRSDNLPINAPFPLGTTLVVWTATDACGNAASCTQQVVITAGSICGVKYDDVNTNGVRDGGEAGIGGWKVLLSGTDAQGQPVGPLTALTGPNGSYCFNGLPLGTYQVSEVIPTSKPVWKAVTPTLFTVALTNCDASYQVNFGNVCLGAGGGLTLGFWSNNNGQAILKKSDMLLDGSWRQVLNGLSLRNANGSLFTVSLSASFSTAYTSFRNWLLSASATNMAYMLSAQLAAMELNIHFAGVSPSAIVYEGPPPSGCSGTVFIPLGDAFVPTPGLLNDARLLLVANGNTTALNSQDRICQEYKKIAIDNANNNLNFVQSSPCPFLYGSSATLTDPGLSSQSLGAGPAGAVDGVEGLQGAFPNPFAGSTRIAYAIGSSSDARVSIRIYNVAGRLVRTLVEGVDTPGRHDAIWDGRTDTGEMVSRGIYFVRSSIGGQTQSMRIIRLQ